MSNQKPTFKILEWDPRTRTLTAQAADDVDFILNAGEYFKANGIQHTDIKPVAKMVGEVKTYSYHIPEMKSKR